jgi:hypothetical protein
MADTILHHLEVVTIPMADTILHHLLRPLMELRAAPP